MFEVDYKNIKNLNLKNLLLTHGLLIIKDGTPNVLEFESIANSLGKCLVTDKHAINENRTIQELSNVGLFGTNEVNWHNDWSYGRGNYFGTILYNVKNAHLSPTWFCNMSNLPETFYKKHEKNIGVYYPPANLQDQCFTDKQLRILEKQKISRQFVHTHHVTGERVLYCSPGTIQDFNEDLSDIIQYAEEHSYCHTWEPNDILIWDNLKMMHKRNSFEGQRLLWRTQFII